MRKPKYKGVISRILEYCCGQWGALESKRLRTSALSISAVFCIVYSVMKTCKVWRV